MWAFLNKPLAGNTFYIRIFVHHPIENKKRKQQYFLIWRKLIKSGTENGIVDGNAFIGFIDGNDVSQVSLL